MSDGFVYKWTNTISGKWYIGSHKGDINDNYRHTSEIMKLAEKKYGINSFVREILYVGSGYRAEESRYLNESNAAHNTQSYNRSNMTGPNCRSKESIERNAAANRGRKHTKQTCENMSLAKKGKTWEEIFGVDGANERRKARNEFRHTEETKEQMSEAHKLAYKEGRRTSVFSERPAWNKGKQLSKKHRQNLSLSHIGNIPCNKGQKGIFGWYNNGTEEKFMKQNQVPIGWIKGRTCKTLGVRKSE